MSAPDPTAFQYSPGFYDFIEQGARRSADLLLPRVARAVAPASVLDVGCGRGIWLAAWPQLGARDLLGLDGPYVQVDRLAVPPAAFRSLNVTQCFDLGRRWDLVQCLEVAEHIPPSTSSCLVENLVRHGDRVLFSAAVPGQGGHNHINERPLEYWRGLFAAQGYHAFDVVRPELAGQAAIAPWYRFNTLLYVRASAVAALPDWARQTALDPARSIPDYAPLSWRLRRLLLRPLPVGAVTALGRLKNRVLRSS